MRYESKDRELGDFQGWLASSPQVQAPELEEEVKSPEELRELSKVISITEENASILEKNTVLVAFIAPWGQFVEALLPELDALSIEMEGQVMVATIDISDQPALATRFEVRAVPAIQLHYRGDIHPHNGGRTVSFLSGFVKRITQPKVINDEEEGICRFSSNVIELHAGNIDRHMKEKDHLFIAFYAPWCRFCMDMLPKWDNLADDERFFIARIDAIQEESVRVKFRISGYPTMILWQREGDQRTRFLGDRTVSEWTAFLEENLLAPQPTEQPEQAGDMIM